MHEQKMCELWTVFLVFVGNLCFLCPLKKDAVLYLAVAGFLGGFSGIGVMIWGYISTHQM